MKRLAGFAIVALVFYYLWKNHFSKLLEPKNNVTESLEEIALKQDIGDSKRSAFLASQFPWATIGDTPYAGVPLTAINDSPISNPKKLVLLPKGGNTTSNPFDRVLDWLN
jgi:hypothetical protein